jgi:hypothetical protein
MRFVIGCLAVAMMSACGGSASKMTSADGEPNNSFATATPISLGSTFSGSVAAGGSDVDYYSFTVPAGGRLVRLETFDSTGAGCAGNILPAFVLYDSTQAAVPILSTVLFSGSCQYSAQLLPAGTYYLRVSYDTSFAPPPFGYVLKTAIASSVVTTTEVEPNDNIASANGPYSTSQLIAGAEDGTSDYFAIRNATGSAVTVRLQLWVGGLGQCSYFGSWYLSMYDAAGSPLDFVTQCVVYSIAIPANTTYSAGLVGFSTSEAYLLDVLFP